VKLFGRTIWPDRFDYILFGGLALLSLWRFATDLQAGRIGYVIFHGVVAPLLVFYTYAHWKWARAYNLGVQARRLIREDESESALQILDTCLSYFPDSLEYVFNKGVALLKLGRAEESLEWFDRALELDPSLERAQQLRAQALRVLSDHAESSAEEAPGCGSEPGK